MQRQSFVLGACALAALASSTQAQFDPHLFRTPQVTEPVPLPNQDARRDDDGQPLPFVRAALERQITPQARLAREAALNRLRQRVQGVVVDASDLFGTPHFVRSTRMFLTPPHAGGKAEGEAVVRAFLDEYRGLFEVSPGELVSAELARDLETQHNGMRHLTWKQRYGGVRIVDCELRANLTRHGELVNVSSTLMPRPAGDFQPPAARLSDLDAVLRAAASVGVAVTTPPEPLGAPAGASRARAWGGSPDFRADEPLTSEFVYFPLSRGELRPAWLVAIPEIGIGNTYEVTVDATDGQILRRWNRLHFAAGGTQSISLRVFTSESPAPGTPGPAAPNGFQYPTVPQTLLTIPAAQVLPWSPNHWIDDGVNETIGNNVDAHLDLNADNLPDLPRPMGTPARTFDFLVDTTQAPSTYRPGAIVQFFYLSNKYHDKFMELGFDEAAKNFQDLNFSGQGLGGDRIQADVQDGSGTNNANWTGSSGVDGTTGRVQMYVFDGPAPDRDGDLDADIVYHELTHGTSIRLLDGQVFGEQAGGMGEGWGDFVGIAMSSEPSDPPAGIYTVGGWTTYQLGGSYVDNYYFGIRRFPTSTDLTKNPQTYADIDPGQQSYPPGVPRSTLIGNTADEVHNVGEIWCVTLWEARANLIATHGFAAGNELILQYVVDGMKLSPATPNMLQARDAILQSDLVATGGANLTQLWTGFAKRGMGASATSPSGSTTTGIVEAFDMPNGILFGYPSGRPETLLPAQPTTFQVDVLGLGGVIPTPNSGQLHVSVNGGAYSTIPMTQTTTNHYTATIPGASCLDRVDYYVSVGSNTGPVNDPTAAPSTVFTALVVTGAITTLYDDFESDLGWFPTNQGATSGQWERGVPVNDPGWDYDPTSDADGSGQCWLTQNQAGNTDVDNGAVRLEGINFDLTSLYGTIEYDYYLALTVEDGTDRLLVEISPNAAAGPWTTIAVHDSDSTGWRHHVITAAEVSAQGVGLTNFMRLRFTANDGGDPSIVEAGIDAFHVGRQVCAPPPTPYCFGDGSGTACPCGNFAPPGQGCASSLGHGATLTSTGSAIVAEDTLVLIGAGMPNSSALYFQGTNQDAGGNGVPFGDGLRCTSGSIQRLGTKANQAGSSSYPGPGDQPIHIRGNIPAAGATRNYQVWYRNAANFCTASTFNLSHGLRVIWSP